MSQARSLSSTCASRTCASSGTSPDCASTPETLAGCHRIHDRRAPVRRTDASHDRGTFRREQAQPLVVVVAPADHPRARPSSARAARPIAAMRDADDPVETEIVEAVSRIACAPSVAKPWPQASGAAIADLDVGRLSRVLEREPADERAGIAARRVPVAEIRVERVIARMRASTPATPSLRRAACRCRCIASPADRCRGGRDRRSPPPRTRAFRGAASRATAPAVRALLLHVVLAAPVPRAARPDAPARAPS